MVIAPGDAEGRPGNRHRGADQWLYVAAGQGVAKSGRARHPLKAGTLLLIEQMPSVGPWKFSRRP